MKENMLDNGWKHLIVFIFLHFSALSPLGIETWMFLTNGVNNATRDAANPHMNVLLGEVSGASQLPVSRL